MAIEPNLVFNTANPLPERDDGAYAIVKLSVEKMEARGIEYHGGPVIVQRWSELRTTLNSEKLSYEDVVAWIEI